MSRIDYKEVREIPFEDVLAHYNVNLTPKNISGDEKLQGRCPIHTNGVQERGKNHFQVTVQSKTRALENTFHCFACDARGSVIDFVVLMEKLVDVASVDWEEVSESRKNGSKTNWCPTDRLKVASQLLHMWFLDNGAKRPTVDSETAEQSSGLEDLGVNPHWVDVWGKLPTYRKFYKTCEYLSGRGIAPDVLEEFGVGFYSNPRSRSKVNNHILFPLEDESGELIAMCWRTLADNDQRYCFPPATVEIPSKERKFRFDRTALLWNLHRALKRDSGVVVVEGFFSCMNLWQHEMNAVALMGSSLSDRQVELLREHFDWCTVLIEPDKAGQKLRRQVVKKLLPTFPVRIVEVDKDPDQMSGSEINNALGG